MSNVYRLKKNKTTAKIQYLRPPKVNAVSSIKLDVEYQVYKAMKIIIILFIMICVLNIIKGQNAPPPPPPPPIIEEEFDCIRMQEEMPRFPGCEDLPTIAERNDCSNKKMLEFIYSNLKYPTEDCIEGKVIVKFVIERDGNVTNVDILKGLCKECDAEVLQVIKKMPQWRAGRQNGRLVRIQYALPVKFHL